jgi:hypothetical protein
MVRTVLHVVFEAPVASQAARSPFRGLRRKIM